MLPVGILNASKRKVRITRNRTMAVLMALVHSHIHRPVEMDPRDSSAVLRRARSPRSAETRPRPPRGGEGPARLVGGPAAREVDALGGDARAAELGDGIVEGFVHVSVWAGAPRTPGQPAGRPGHAP